MNPFSRILVALDLSSLDECLIHYSNYLAQTFDVENIYFIHNIKKYEISEIIEQEIDDVDLEEAISEELNDRVSGIMSDDINWEVLISDDPYTESLINYICNKLQINSILLGNKNGKNGSGSVGFKLLRLLKCNIFWVPKLENFEPKSIWITTDFSSASQKSFKVGALFQKQTSSQVTAVHVYNVPLHFSPYINNSKIETKVDNHIHKKFDQFVKKIDYPFPLQTLRIAGREANAASKIRQESKRYKVSLIIVSDKGANTFSNLIVGSVTMELFMRHLDIPLFITKPS